METEIWKSHPYISGIEVSTLGRVRTLDRLGSRENRTYSKKGHVLKQHDNGIGYLQVHVPVDGKRITKSVHRLIAQAFIPNPDNLPEINHKDNNPLNNDVSNLEWVTHEENIAYREKYGEAQNKPVLAINLTTLEVSRFSSQSEVSRVLGLQQQNVNAVIKGRQKTAGGYWFTNDDENAADAIKRKLHTLQSQALGL